MPKSINNIPGGTKFKYLNKTYTKLIHLDYSNNKPHDKCSQHYGVEEDNISFRYFPKDFDLLTEETVETTTEEWVQKYTFDDLFDGDTFRWIESTSKMECIKMMTRDSRYIWHDGYTSLTENKHYMMCGLVFSKTDKVWTLEKVTKTEKKWV